jgi:hypothetical protein
MITSWMAWSIKRQSLITQRIEEGKNNWSINNEEDGGENGDNTGNSNKNTTDLSLQQKGLYRKE